MMDSVATRAMAGFGLVLSASIGVWTMSRLTLDTAAAAETTMAKRISPEQAQREALGNKPSYAESEEFYRTRIDEAVALHHVTAPTFERLKAPNPFVQVASAGAPRTVAPGASLNKAGFELRVRTESIAVESRGMRTKAQHTLVDIENVGEVPIAYFLELHTADGTCQVRAMTRYNAMALMPGEKGEISVCGGTHDVEVRDLRIMEITELGAMWVSKVPALAVGHDSVIARSHFPGVGIEMCAEIPSTEFAQRIAKGELEWEDSIDFYSRHDCDHYRWVPGYRRATEPLERLP